MHLIQTPLDRRYGWKSPAEIGSPWRLFRLVWELSAHERRAQRMEGPREAAGQRLAIEATKKQARSYLGLLSMKRTAVHYVNRMAIQREAYAVDSVLDRHIHEYQQSQSVDRALKEAGSENSTDFGIRVLTMRKRELEQGVYAPEALEPGDLDIGTDALEIYRRGVALEAAHDEAGARRMYMRALEADPAFPLALRRLAGLERSSNPAAAAVLYSEALDFIPKENYGEPGTLHVLEVYRNFLLTRRDGQFLAIPVAVGKVDFSSDRSRSGARRFAGLLLMRLRLRASGLPAPASALNADAAGVAPPTVVTQAHRDAGISPMAASKSTPVAVGPIKAALRFLVRWLARHMDLFHFVIAGASMDDLKHQIDKVDREWLSRGAIV